MDLEMQLETGHDTEFRHCYDSVTKVRSKLHTNIMLNKVNVYGTSEKLYISCSYN